MYRIQYAIAATFGVRDGPNIRFMFCIRYVQQAYRKFVFNRLFAKIAEYTFSKIAYVVFCNQRYGRLVLKSMAVVQN